MKIVFYVAGMKFDGKTLEEGQSLGGSETAGICVAEEMAKRGHIVFMFCRTPKGEPMMHKGVNYMDIGPASEQYEFGSGFMSYALSVPHDVLVCQRVPGFFRHNYNSKVNLWWNHDLALKRNQHGTATHIWNVDRVLGVSKFHIDQIEKVYGLDRRILDVLPNGVDFSLVPKNDNVEGRIQNKLMLYSSRPERGLENLVKEGGIMEQLYSIDPDIRLAVCGYDNVTNHMKDYYNFLWHRCEILPNVDNLGPLSKEQLYQTMSNAWLHCYPTSFEETSCITAMEAQANGLPIMTTKTGALPETLNGAGVKFTKIENFVRDIIDLSKKPSAWKQLHEKALRKSKEYDWSKAGDALERIIGECFEDNTSNDDTLVRHLVYNSDVVAAVEFLKEHPNDKYSKFIEDQFEGILNGSASDFYEDVADYNTNRIKNDHNLGNDAVHINMPRLRPIFDFVATLPNGSEVLDYGCCVGQVTTALARTFPNINFTACDISKLQVGIGKKYADENNIKNLRFIQANDPFDLKSKLEGKLFDAVTCSEVMEHVPNYIDFVAGLEALTKDSGSVFMTVPSGPYELLRWDVQTKREHIHHFEDMDLLDIFGKKNGFQCGFVPNNCSPAGDHMGNFFFTWKHDEENGFGVIDYKRKFRIQKPNQTLSVCMIVKPDGNSLGACLKSVVGIADEIIIGIDGKENEGRAWQVAKEFGAETFRIESPLSTGFDEARNQTIRRASKDWILWIDDDETLVHPERVVKYLRNNQFNAYGIAQHHFAAEPAGILKTDLPCRLFRNEQDIRFFGVVHEHPETKVNEGPGQVFLIPQGDVCVCHNGYETEEVRVKRFERNFGLMIRDRKKYPERFLGKFLWIRDLAHMNRFELMRTNTVSNEILDRANEAIEMWRNLVDLKQVRLANDALMYTNECVELLSQGQCIELELGVGINAGGIGDRLDGQVPSTKAKFLNEDDVRLYAKMVLDSKIGLVTGDYL